jgi:hypothetical protein
MLGVDFKGDFAVLFSEEDLGLATITRESSTGTYDPDDPSAAPANTTAVYTCSAAAFSFDLNLIPQEQIKATDYLVTIMIGTIKDSSGDLASYTPQPGDLITIPPPGQSAPVTATVSRIASLTEAFVTCVVAGFPGNG